MALPEPLSLPRADAWLAHHARTRTDVDAWVEGERRISFAEAQVWVDALAGGLLAHGLVPGQRVAVHAKPCPAFMALFLAISSVGGIYVGLNPKYTEAELAVVMADCRPTLLFNLLDGEPAHVRKIEALADRAEGSCWVVSGRLLDAFAKTGKDVPTERLQAARDAVRGQDTALLVYTSGTTGAPKGAQLTHRGIVFIAPITNDPAHFGVEGQGRTLCNLPVNHVGCVVDLCTNCLVTGTTVVFQPDFDPDAMLQAIETHRLTMIGGVPAMFLAVSRSPRFRSTDYSSLQKIILAGNQPPLPLVRLLREVTGRPVMNGYGLTEAMGFSTFTAVDDDAETVAGTVGRFDARIGWRVADGAGHPCPKGTAGEVQLHGDWLFTGYFQRPDATAEAFAEGGWFRTGDIAVVTPEGRVQLVGRSKEMFKSGGYNVYPLEIEQALEALAPVTMAVVVPVPDDEYVEVGYAFVVTRKPDDSPAALKAAVRERLANYKVPKHIEVVRDLPMLPIGKVDRLALKARAGAVIARRGAPSPLSSSLSSSLSRLA